MTRTILAAIAGIAASFAAVALMTAGLIYYAYSKGVVEINIAVQSAIAVFAVFWAALLAGRIARERALGVALFTALAFEVIIAAANRWSLAQIELLRVSVGDKVVCESRVWIASRMIVAALAGTWAAVMWAKKKKRAGL
jgi:hypothetical protein